jgi:glycosyltransferase involved in cell wall biosynthesis
MIRPLRVVMLLGDGFGGFGGIAKFNRDFLSALAACACVGSVHVLPRAISEPIEAPIPDAVDYDHKASAGTMAYALRLLRRLLQRDAIDIVICGHRNLLLPSWLLARMRGAHLVLIVHGVEAWQPSANAVTNALAGRIDALVAVSRLTARRFCGWAKVEEARAFILSNGIDLVRFKPQPKDQGMAARYGLRDGKTLLTLGRLQANERYKGIDEVIELMPRLLRQHPQLTYVIAGDGSDRPRLEAKVKGLGLGQAVIFTGRVAEADKVALYNLADAFVMPSAGEGFGIVLIEAAACGIPVIGGARDAGRETLLDGKLGRFADAADSDALFGAVDDALRQGRRNERPAGIEIYSSENFARRVAQWADLMSEAVAAGPAQALSGEIQ